MFNNDASILHQQYTGSLKQTTKAASI